MNKEFIPYKQALALKELGFDEPCFGIHYNEGLNPSFMVASQYGEHGATANGGILAPLYQQAFRWFREKYGLWQIVMQNTDKDWTYDIMPIIGIIDYKIFDVFDNYEEAELECIIKLIEIVKNK
jgi:hypothetical protein